MYCTWCYSYSMVYCSVWLQNPRMEQALADMYFLVVMEHMLSETMADTRLDIALNKINSMNEVCWKGSEKVVMCDSTQVY